jgi:hypothetical protein
MTALYQTDVETASSAASQAWPGVVELRSIPYPYRSLLAICSDLDETPDSRVYIEQARYLNTRETTAIGRGVGLEVGNTLYFDMDASQFAYWNTDDRVRAAARALIRSGHIDCLHSFGDLALTRQHAARALDELVRHDCRIQVWVDHAQAITNFGEDIMLGQGDVPSSPAYHADLTTSYGVRYVWRGRVTSVIGQNAPRSLHGVFDGRHPAASAKTVAKEWAKGVLAGRGNRKYRLHAANRVLAPASLRDGTPVIEFLRCNPYWEGVQLGATAAGMADVFTEKTLSRFVQRNAVGVFYTHLGKIGREPGIFSARTREAFERLAGFYENGEILVTTTRRLLGYCEAAQKLSFNVTRDGESCWIDVSSNGVTEFDASGLTFNVEDAESIRLRVDGKEISEIQRNAVDWTGHASVSVPWRRLEFPTI